MFDRKDFVRKMELMQKALEQYQLTMQDMEEAIRILKMQIPNAILKSDGYSNEYHECSNCGKTFTWLTFNGYCEQCGQRLIW